MGIKQVGATAHFLTPDPDEGPIIEQEVIRADHTYGPEDLVTVGRDAECFALAHTVRWHGEHRVLLNNDRTLVFSLNWNPAVAARVVREADAD